MAPPSGNATSGAGNGGSERGKIPGHAVVEVQERADIGADAEKADLAEMGVAGIAADPVPGIGEHQEDQELDGEGDRVVGADKRQHDRDNGGDAGDSERVDAFHTRTPAPSSPRGRTSSTASIRRNRKAEPITAPAK